jgi:hypothetical protein
VQATLRELVKSEGGIDQFRGDKKKQKEILAKLNAQVGSDLDYDWVKKQLKKMSKK